MAFKMKMNGRYGKGMPMKSPAKLKEDSPMDLKSPMKDAGTIHMADMKESNPDKYMKFAKKHDKAYGKGHPDSYHEMGQNPTEEEKKAFLEKQKAKKG